MTGTEKPNLQTRLNIPGLHFFPKVNPEDAVQLARFKENENIALFWNSTVSENIKYYEDIVEAEKKIYDEKMLSANTRTDQNVVDVEWSELGECGNAPYGWNGKTPCVFFRLNRVIDWEPVGLFKPEEGTFFGEAGNGLTTNMIRNGVYIRCKDIGTRKEDSPALLSFDYFGGKDGNLDEKYYPYQGKALQPDYQSPIVAVKILGLKDGHKYRVRCHAFAQNIVINDRDNLGSISFEVQHGGTATKR